MVVPGFDPVPQWMKDAAYNWATEPYISQEELDGLFGLFLQYSFVFDEKDTFNVIHQNDDYYGVGFTHEGLAYELDFRTANYKHTVTGDGDNEYAFGNVAMRVANGNRRYSQEART